MLFYKRLPALYLALALVFTAQLVAPRASNIPWAWDGVDRIVAVGDIHGDYDHFVTILRAVGILDEDLNWVGGTTHLVQTGDIMDRGPDARKVFDLIRRLEVQALEAGGRVHMLIANHEEMNLAGIAFDYPGYVTVEQFLSFLPADYVAHREKAYYQQIHQRSSATGLALQARPEELYAFWQDVIRTDAEARRTYVRYFDETYAPWILQHNAVIRINDIIFVHGGISPKFADWSLEKINRQLRRELESVRRSILRGTLILGPFHIAYQPEGPLWYRGLATYSEEIFAPEVDRILQKLHARFIVIGHTIRGTVIQSRFGNRVWLIDTGISRVYGGHLSALIIERGRFIPWKGPVEEKP